MRTLVSERFDPAAHTSPKTQLSVFCLPLCWLHLKAGLFDGPRRWEAGPGVRPQVFAPAETRRSTIPFLNNSPEIESLDLIGSLRIVGLP